MVLPMHLLWTGNLHGNLNACTGIDFHGMNLYSSRYLNKMPLVGLFNLLYNTKLLFSSFSFHDLGSGGNPTSTQRRRVEASGAEEDLRGDKKDTGLLRRSRDQPSYQRRHHQRPALRPQQADFSPQVQRMPHPRRR